MDEQVHRVDRDNISAATRRLYSRASLVAVVGNLALFGAKWAAAQTSGSSAIYADAANSASDVAYSLLMALGLWLSLRPPDAGHPHGHRRIESLVSLLIGAMMGYAAFEAGSSGVAALRDGARPTLTAWALAVLLGTGAVKTGMFLLSRRLASRAGSPALLATARDNLTDIASSAMALVGYLLGRFVVTEADAIAALLVAAWIARAAAAILLDGLRQLTGGAAPSELEPLIVDAVRAVPGVRAVERVITEYVGPKINVDIHIKMAGNVTLEHVHAVSHQVRQIIEAHDEVDHAYVHVEPYRGENGPPRPGET